MSIDVQNVQFNQLENLRWSQFKHMKEAGLTDIAIAHNWHLKSTKQVQRLKKKAKENGEYQKWMQDFIANCHEEFWPLHHKIKKKNPELAYVEIGRKIERSLTQKMETRQEISKRVEIDVEIRTLLERYETVIERASNRNLRENNSTQQVDTR